MAKWAGISTAELVDDLARSGLDIDRHLVEELLRRGIAAVPCLAQVLDGDRYWRLEKEVGDGWAPISALHLLAAIADPDGLEPILRVLHRRPDDLGDWLTEDIPSILACFGPAAVEPVKELVSNRYLDVYVRVAGSGALSLIAREHPDCKDEIVDFFHEILVREGEDKTFLSFCVGDLAEIKDPSAKPIMRSLFDGSRIDEEIITWSLIEDIYQTWGDDLLASKEDPMRFFSPENLNYLRKLTEEIQSEHRTQTTVPWSALEEPEKRKVGRNDPCPCGSGKKYKKCCLQKTRSQRKVDEDERNLRDRILEFAALERFSYDWKRALDMYRVGSGDVDFEEFAEEVEFIDWVIHDYRCMGSGEPLVTIFAREKASSLNERQRGILTEWQNTLFGVYEVVGISKGEGLQLKDIITGEEYFAYDVSASNAATLWDLLVTRVISVDGRLGFGGAGKFLPQTRKRDLKDFLETGFMQYQEVHRGSSFREFLREKSHTVIQYASQEEIPTVKTSEGDDFYLARALFELKDREATKRTLDKMEELRSTGKNDDGAHIYNWLETEHSAHPEERRHGGGGIEGHRVLGVVTLTHDSLELECFSKERLSRLQDLLERELKSSITFLADLSMDMETALKQSRDRPREEAVLPKDEEKRVVKEHLNRYYLQKWINTEIPALCDKTPMRAMKTEEGKASLTQLLNEMQNLEERKRKTGDPYFDVDKLRSRLGLPIPRGTTDEQIT
jgi:hypothetical protein